MHSSTDDDPDCPPEFRPDPEAVARRAAELRAHRQRKVACPACGWVGKVTSYDKIRKHLSWVSDISVAQFVPKIDLPTPGRAATVMT